MRFSCKYGAELRAWKWSSKSYKIRTDANGHEAFTARLRPGDLFAVGLYIDAVKVWARVAWPSSAAGPTVAEAWRSPEDLSVVHPAAPQAIPVTSQSSPVPPPLGDWVDSVPVNTAEASRRSASCEARVLQGWLRWRCSGRGLYLGRVEGFGDRGVDHRESEPGSDQYGFVRLVKGMNGSLTIRVDLGGRTETLRLVWPVDSPVPTTISFETVNGA